MFRSVEFPSEIEGLVRLIEETEPERIVAVTIDRLRSGVTPKAMLTASSLAVTRSTELPAAHHGGPIHPISGVHAVFHVSQSLSGEMALLPIVQHVALSNKHIHSPSMGPAILPEIEALEASPGGVDATKKAFFDAIRLREPSAAEGHLLWLLRSLRGDEVLDLILTEAVPRTPRDDHHFLYPILTARALDCIGWEWAPVLLRPVVRYLARNPYPLDICPPSPDFKGVEGLLDTYHLLGHPLPFQASRDETGAIPDLALRLASYNEYLRISEALAVALAGGLSVNGAAEALSAAAAMVFLRTNSGNPMDVHHHTEINATRYVLGLSGVTPRNKLLCLLAWPTGGEIRLGQKKIIREPKLSPEAQPRWLHYDQQSLLNTITESIHSQPPVDLAAIGRKLDVMMAAPQVWETVAMAEHYAAVNYDPQTFFTRMAEITCQDNFTEMHAFKQHRAVVEEFHSTRPPLRWVHLVSLAKAVTVTHGKVQDVFNDARQLLQV